MIPKTIHYCWFGGNPKPKLAEKCIRSWKKHCPDYELIEWSEENFDIASAPLYVRQAYEAKKWAFVTDYVRLYAMVTHGGIYMDTDVEVIKPLDDFLVHQAFSGFENSTDIPTGIMGAEKGFPLFEELLHHYDSAVFKKEDGSYDLTTNVLTITKKCVEKGLIQNNEFQIINGFAVYPKEVFCPYDLATGEVIKTDRTYTIHWFSGSWFLPEQKRDKRRNYAQHRREKIKFLIRIKGGVFFRAIIGDSRYEKLKKLFNKQMKDIEK